MEEKTFQRIKELTELQGTSGFEQDVRAYICLLYTSPSPRDTR